MYPGKQKEKAWKPRKLTQRYRHSKIAPPLPLCLRLMWPSRERGWIAYGESPDMSGLKLSSSSCSLLISNEYNSDSFSETLLEHATYTYTSTFKGAPDVSRRHADTRIVARLQDFTKSRIVEGLVLKLLRTLKVDSQCMYSVHDYFMRMVCFT